MEITGTFPAVPTFLDQDRAVDTRAQRTAIDRLLEAGVDGVVLLGTSGEGMALDPPRRSTALRASRSSGDATIVVGCAGNSTRDVIEAVTAAADDGADAALVPPPYYYTLPETAIQDFYGSISERSPLPLLLYHIPQLTKNQLSIEGMRQLAENPAVIGVKDSSGDALFHLRLLEHQNEHFTVMQGLAPLLFLSYTSGARGATTPISAIFPHLELDLRSAIKNGDIATAQSRNSLLARIAHLLRAGGYPLVSNLKAIAYILGHGPHWSEPPMPTVTEDHLGFLRGRLEQSGLIP